MIHALNEFLEGQFSLYFIRDIIVITSLMLSLLAYKLKWISKKNLFPLVIYIIVIAVAVTFLIGNYDAKFRFEPNFLQGQMILSLLMLIHYKEVKNLLTFNFFLITICYFTVGKEYPLDKFIYHGLIVCGSGIVSYTSLRAFAKLSRKMKEASILIQNQNEELMEMNKAKDRLFKIIGHDLRTPFYQLKYLTEMIANEKDEVEKQKIKALLIESADKGNQLLEDLLSWGNSHQHTSEILLEKYSLSKIVKRAINFSEMIAEKKNITLVNNVYYDLELYINPMMMETVLRNLIANAIKFSYPGSEIIIQTEIMKSQIRIDVVDKGVGMSKERLKTLFINDKNYSTLGTNNEKGSGHGLTISKKLVEKQNGIFEIDSIYKKGTIIRMYFPAS